MKTVIEMAREAGIRSPDLYKLTVGHMSIDQLERFAELVRAEEREMCAKLCEKDWSNDAEKMYGEDCAAVIRARGNT